MTMNHSLKIFSVEPNLNFCRALTHLLSTDPEHEVTAFHRGKQLLEALREQRPELITMESQLPDMSAEELIGRLRQQLGDIPIIIISASQDLDRILPLFRLGIADYVHKGEDGLRERLFEALYKVKGSVALYRQLARTRAQMGEHYDISKNIVGNSAPMQKVFTMLAKAMDSNINVSISGETGTGKELAAKAIHMGSRRSGPFVAVNIAAIPPTLLESELFGHEKGAFTGAIARRIGKFEEAHQGTLFLDEIGEMDVNLQAKLLRVLQEREVVRVGGNEPVRIDVRIVTATHRDLAQEVREGRFREDLYYRLLGMPVPLPPLRERGNDILLISRKIVQQFCRDNKLLPVRLSKDAEQRLLSYHYPGNIRELKAVIELACVLCADSIIGPTDLQFASLGHTQEPRSDREMTLREHTLSLVQHYLEKYDHNVLLVAKKLDIGKSTIYRYLKELETLPR